MCVPDDEKVVIYLWSIIDAISEFTDKIKTFRIISFLDLVEFNSIGHFAHMSNAELNKILFLKYSKFQFNEIYLANVKSLRIPLPNLIEISALILILNNLKPKFSYEFQLIC